MKKGNLIVTKNKIAIAIMAVMILLTACGAASESNVEEEISKALTEDEEEYVIEPEEALEYVEIETPDESIMTDSELDKVSMDAEISASDGEGNTETQAEIDEDHLQIVFMGDSIFDSVRDETGIAAQVAKNLNADVYNLAIGGTTAGLRMDQSTDKDNWTEPSFLGAVYAITGQIPTTIFDKYKSGEVMKSCDFSQTDFFIIEYGTNDFLNYIPLGTDDYKGQYYFYFRTSMDMGITELHKYFPHAQIVICTPYYEEFWSADRTRYIGDAHMVNNGFGTLMDYISVCQDVAKDHNFYCLDMYSLLGVDIKTVNDMTVDGIHPSETARTKYAEILTTTITGLDNGTIAVKDWIAEKEQRDLIIAELEEEKNAKEAAEKEAALLAENEKKEKEKSEKSEQKEGSEAMVTKTDEPETTTPASESEKTASEGSTAMTTP